MLGVVLHVVGDAVNNVGVMIAALAIWKAESDKRYYADPAVSLFIALTIFISAIPLVKHSGLILLQTAPWGVAIGDIKHDLEKVGLILPPWRQEVIYCRGIFSPTGHTCALQRSREWHLETKERLRVSGD